jgi:hypothetical protein
LRALGWLVPAVVLVVLPKCPLCVIGYAALLGVGLSVSTATFLREGLVIGCAALLVTMVVCFVTRRVDVR